MTPVRRGRWQTVRTNAGWHLRLVAGNGETVLTSEVYTREQTAVEAFGVVLNSSVSELAMIDERQKEDHAEPEDVARLDAVQRPEDPEAG